MTVHDGRGAVIKTVNKTTRRRLQKVLSRTEYASAERYFDVYAVVAYHATDFPQQGA